MAENTTNQPVRVTGQAHAHPAVRRLARACIALVRWQRTQAVAEPTPAADAATAVGVKAAEGHS